MKLGLINNFSGCCQIPVSSFKHLPTTKSTIHGNHDKERLQLLKREPVNGENFHLSPSKTSKIDLATAFINSVAAAALVATPAANALTMDSIRVRAYWFSASVA